MTRPNRALAQVLTRRLTLLAGVIVVLNMGVVGYYYGSDRRALDAGDPEAGCTVHLVSEGVDEGPVLDQARVPVLDGDTPATLAARVLEAEHRLYPAALARFCAGLG
jgi:folate-dependent phosphoribosylglycinamide formyltransferase PurN